MGLFDTVFFAPPRKCRNCGNEIDQVQTKAFEPCLQEYQVGDVISGAPMLSGVIREELYCPACNTNPQEVFFSIWHTLLVGVYDDPQAAEQRIQGVDRAELLDYLARHQRQALTWHDRFSRLYGELQNLHDYQQFTTNGTGTIAKDSPQFFRIRDYVASTDPLGELIRTNKPVNPEDETEVDREEESG